MDTRLGRGKWGAGQPRQRTSEAYWRQPVRWNAQRFAECAICGWRGDLALFPFCPSCHAAELQPARRRVFCASLADVFDNEVDPQWRRESGPKARPTHPDWPRSLRDQCSAAGVPFMLKQWGEWTPGENVTRRRGTVRTATWWDGEWSSSDDGHIDDEPDLYCVGKRAAGRLLDGQEHNGFPVVTS